MKTGIFKKKSGESKASMVPREKLSHEIYSDPFVDWALILAIASLAAASLVGVGVAVYLGTGEKLAAPSEQAAAKGSGPIDEAALGSVMRHFEDRAETRASLLRGFSAPKNPYLP